MTASTSRLCRHASARRVSATKRSAFIAEWETSAEAEALFHAQLGRRLENARDVMQPSTESVLHVADHAGHFVHHDDRWLVIDAIRRIAFPDAGRRLRAALAAGALMRLIDTYHEIRRFYPSERFDEQLLSDIGNSLGAAGRTQDAITLLELNVEGYPDSPCAHFNLGVGYGHVGRPAERLRSFERMVELAEQQDDPMLPRYRGNLQNALSQLEGP
jgi:tetratricopeptide (TPR) repeat protein